MAKEMMIVFVYDTEYVQNEEDDPASAILYFCPSWVSDQQRTSLCGQIIGVCHFLNNTFACPRIFALQSGKFSIRTHGRYILAVGTDRNIPDWVLEYRADTLTSLISFFHRDLEKIGELYKDNSILSAKLYHTFETYLKIIMYGGNLFFNIPTIHLPKSASNVFLEVMQLLQSCQQMNHVLGGTILYHNKVVATQLSTELTKRVVLTDPYRIKSPAETFDTGFSLPLGVQLLQVYIPYEDYLLLQEDSIKSKFLFQCLKKANVKKTLHKQSSLCEREPILSAMKRDQSLIFTMVPEEDSVDNKIIKAKSPDRPKSLNLKTKTTDSKCNETQSDKKLVASTPFQTSVCSTPMTDKVLFPSIMSICINPDKTTKDNSSKNFINIDKVGSVNTNNNCDDEHSKPKEDCLMYISIENNLYDKKKNTSMWDVREKRQKLNKRITINYYNLGLPYLNNDAGTELVVSNSARYKTIGDPTFPVSKSNGAAVSRFLYEQYLQEPIDLESMEPYRKGSNVVVDSKENRKEQPKLKTDEKLEKASSSKELRKMLTLPLKALATPSEQTDNSSSPLNCGRTRAGVQLTPLISKLSLLAMEERLCGYSNKHGTPADCKDARLTSSHSNHSFMLNKSKPSFQEELQNKRLKLQEVVLFICGQQDMVMEMLLDVNVQNSPEVINELWEKSTQLLGKIERQLRHCLETYPSGRGESEGSESYSYLSLDSECDIVECGGPWGNIELGMLTHLHRDFNNMANLTEIILRNDESIIYGNHCGKKEVFYQQVALSSMGLPTPADPMGTVSLKAKRHLERDHSIILL